MTASIASVARLIWKVVFRTAIGLMSLVIIFFASFVFPPLFIIILATDLILRLAIGWIFFLKRISGEINVHISSLLLFIGSLMLIAFLMNYTARWLLTRPVVGTPPALPAPSTVAWSFHQSCAVIMAVLCSSVAGICMVGMTHEFIWVASSKTRLIWIDSENPAQRTASKHNLKGLGLALSNYHDDHGGFPPSITFEGQGRIRHGWVAPLLPYLDEAALSKRVHLDLAWNAAENRPVLKQKIKSLINPGFYHRRSTDDYYDDDGYAVMDYAANQQMFQPGRNRGYRDMTDGRSNTILGGEVNALFPAWGKPGNSRDVRLGINEVPEGFGGPFTGGTHFMLGDGTVRFISQNISPEVLKALSTPDGGEVVGDF